MAMAMAEQKAQLQTPTSSLLPGLPDELLLLCLPRLSLRAQARCRCVSPAWRRALQPASLHALRRQLSMPDQLLAFLCIATGDFDEEWRMTLGGGIKWLLLDSLHHGCDVLAPGSHPSHPPGFELHLKSPQFMPADGKILLHGLSSVEPLTAESEQFSSNSNGLHEIDLLGFDVLRRRWCSSAPRMIEEDRFEFAWAKLDDYLYVAGGRPDEIYSDAYKSAERFNLKTEQWETLPDMNENRQVCSGFVMEGCFYVIGGLPNLDSGEFFDPRMGVWTLVPRMWPAPIAATTEWVLEPPTVAVVKEQLYALKYMSTEIFWYDRLRNSWVSVGDFPDQWRPSQEHRMVSVGDEIWLILNDHESPLSVIGGTPQGAGAMQWRCLPFEIPERPEYEKVIAWVVIEA